MENTLQDIGSGLWNFVARHGSYMFCLEENVTTLKTKMEELKAIREDVKLKVQLAELEGMVQSNKASEWLTRVQETEDKANEILAEHEETGRFGFIFGSTYKLGKKSTNLVTVVNELIIKGGFSEVAIQPPHPTPTREETVGLCEIPMADQNSVGIESNLEKVLKGLKDDNVGIIGLYGMGGVGKTTLLKKINNQLPRSGDDAFECALWVVASSNATIKTLQQTMMNILAIPCDGNKTVDEASIVIYNKLKNRKYILMLDDLWEMIDLYGQVGIPKPGSKNKSKIIFTTRWQSVCSQMQAKPIRVDCLPWEEAWSLFQEKVGKVALIAEIKIYAEEVAKKCQGLPLALITIGSAMSSKEHPYEWSLALDQLQTHTSEFKDLDTKVFRVLQLSYDNLGDPTKQQCFLYCSLFPEDCDIPNYKLVDLWMGEGYLSKYYDITKARDYGYSIIADLKRACLLESGRKFMNSDTVKMHDVIRDMALRITNKKFLCLGKVELMRIERDDQNWNEGVEKMWLSVNNSNKEVMLARKFPKLSTILLEHVPPTTFQPLLSKSAPEVKVLRLPYDSGENLLKEISNLENLECLDIPFTHIGRLPKEMKRLRKLKYLLMDRITIDLEEGLSEIISGLTQLLVFRMDWVPCSEELLRVLENLQNIQEIEIFLNSGEKINFLLKSVKLQLCTRYMRLTEGKGVLIFCPTKLRNLQTLRIQKSMIEALRCSNPTPLKVFDRLCEVQVFSCNCLLELDILAYAPSLTYLRVFNCSSLQKIVSIKEANHVFLSLNYLYLYVLPSLKIICNMTSTFPALEVISIERCPKLEQNPFNDMIPATNSMLRKINVDQRWWDSLEWRDDHLRNHFSLFFINK